MDRRPQDDDDSRSGSDDCSGSGSASGSVHHHHAHGQLCHRCGKPLARCRCKTHQHHEHGHSNVCDACGKPFTHCHCHGRHPRVDRHHAGHGCCPQVDHQHGFHLHHPFFSHFCDNRLRLNLAGLAGNLNFQLLRLKGCRVKVVFECGGRKEEAEGCICGAGVDHVDIKQANHTVVTILTERICVIEWQDPACNPCSPCPPLHHGCAPCPPC